MANVHNIDREYELNNQKLQNSEHVSEENKRAIARFSDKCFAEGLSKARVRKYLTSFHTILQLAPEDFELLDAEKEELESVVAEIEQLRDYSEWTRKDFKVTLKKFYKTMEGEGQVYPDKVKFIDTNIDETELESPDVLDREEIEDIIQACKNDRDRAMYKLLYEGGLRAGELVSLRISDIDFVDAGVRVNVIVNFGEIVDLNPISLRDKAISKAVEKAEHIEEKLDIELTNEYKGIAAEITNQHLAIMEYPLSKLAHEPESKDFELKIFDREGIPKMWIDDSKGWKELEVGTQFGSHGYAEENIQIITSFTPN